MCTRCGAAQQGIAMSPYPAGQYPPYTPYPPQGQQPPQRRRSSPSSQSRRRKKKKGADPALVIIFASIIIGIVLGIVLVFRFIIFADLDKKADVGLGKGGQSAYNGYAIITENDPREVLRVVFVR